MSGDDSYRERYRDVLSAAEKHTSESHPMVKKRNLAIVVAEATGWSYSDIKDTIEAAIERDDLFRHYERVAPMSEEALVRIQMAEDRADRPHDTDLVAHCNRALGRLDDQ
jgi:hypothetical protein